MSGLLYGVATSAFQIEGAWNVDGKGVSIWDTFTEKGKVVCDDYHRFSETLASLQEFGVDIYRFSIAWTRIFPEGRGEVNQQGIEYYRSIISQLIASNIQPMVTIYHWDLP